MNTVVEILQEAVQEWYQATGCPVDQSKSIAYEQLELVNQAKEVAKLLDMDTSGVSSYTLLRAYFEYYLKETNFNAFDLILNKSKCAVRLSSLERVRDLLNHEDVVTEIKRFDQAVRNAIVHYGAEPNEHVLGDMVAMAVLRRDAVMAMSQLRVHQFVQGDPSNTPIGVNPHVFEFWNIQSLVRVLSQQNYPGVSICLIREPKVLESYFVFAISNGQNLTILTDKSPDLHPMSKHMRRRPDREFLKRAGQYHFPYELTDVKKSDDQQWEVAVQNRTNLVPLQTHAVRVAKISDLRPETITWFALMFDLIREKFGVEQYQTPALSYTADMIREPEAIVSGSHALVKTGVYQPLSLQLVSKADLTDEKLKDQWGHPPVGINDWMIERYGKQVPEQVLNLLGKDDHPLLEVEKAGTAMEVYRQGFLDKPASFISLSPTIFGTEEEIVRDQVWTARYNQMVAIQRLADHEFRETKHKIWDRDKKNKSWYYKKVKENLQNLLEAIARGYLDEYDSEPRGLRHLMSQRWMDTAFSLDWDSTEPTCAVNGTNTELYVAFIPQDSVDVAMMCGCTVEQLPWQLQHWTQKDPYTGNHLLNRLDPKDWFLKNPWNRIKLGVRVNISRSGYNSVRKAMGLPPKVLDTTKK